MVSSRSIAVAPISIASTPFGDHLSCRGSAQTDAEDALGFGIDHQLGDAFGAIERNGAAGSTPGKLCDFDFAALVFRLSFGEAGPGDFRIGEDDGGNRIAARTTPSCPTYVPPPCGPRARPCGPASARRPRRQWHRSPDRRSASCRLTSMNPLGPTTTLVFSSPGICEFGRRPTEIRTRS